MFIPFFTLHLHNTYHINGISLGYNLTTLLIVCRIGLITNAAGNLQVYGKWHKFQGFPRGWIYVLYINDWRKSMSGRVSQGEAPESTWCVSGREQSITFGRMALGSGSSHFKINDGVVGQSKSVFTDVGYLCEEFLQCLRRLVWLLTHTILHTLHN